MAYSKRPNESEDIMNYNLVLYIGLFLIVGGFCLFLYSEMRLAQLDREQWKNDQLMKSFMKGQNKWPK